jgi:hypothetical protein
VKSSCRRTRVSLLLRWWLVAARSRPGARRANPPPRCPAGNRSGGRLSAHRRVQRRRNRRRRNRAGRLRAGRLRLGRHPAARPRSGLRSPGLRSAPRRRCPTVPARVAAALRHQSGPRRAARRRGGPLRIRCGVVAEWEAIMVSFLDHEFTHSLGSRSPLLLFDSAISSESSWSREEMAYYSNGCF